MAIGRLLYLCACAAALGAAGSASAFEVAESLGVDNLRSGLAPAVGVEVRADPLWSDRYLKLGLAAAAEIDSDAWAGAGPLLLTPLTDRWRIELSLMLGWYHDGGGNDLGTDFPMFRSQFGISYAFVETWRIGAAINHKSNARTAERNPGVETLFVTLAHRF